MKASEIVDDVLMFLENNKRKAVDSLFNGDEAYKKTWMDRDVVKFWQHLDLGNREALVKMAIAHYAQYR